MQETLSSSLKNNKIKLEETGTSLTECESELNEALKDSEDEFKSLEKKRVGLSEKIDARFLSLYNRMRRGRRGMGIISVHKNACGSCYNIVPSVEIIQLSIHDIHLNLVYEIQRSESKWYHYCVSIII